TFVMLSTIGLYVCARYSGDTPPGPREVALRIARFPPIWALALGLTLMPADPPHWIGAGLQRLADAMLPLVMLAVGLSIRLRLPREELGPLLTGLSLKLLVMPAIALPLSLLFGMPPLMLRANVLESAMPTMVSAAALAMAHGLAPRLCAALVGYGIVVCLATLPAWAWLLARFYGGGGSPPAGSVRRHRARQRPLAQRRDLLGHQHRQRAGVADLLHQQGRVQRPLAGV